MRHTSLTALVLVALVGCSSSSSTSNDPHGDPDGKSSGGLSLRVVKAGLTPKLGPLPAGDGNVFVVVDVTLANDSIAPSLAENLALFTLTTKSALVVRASPATTATATPCRAEVSVATSGAATCELAFEIAKSEVATSLAYDDLQGHTATATVPVARALPPTGSTQPPDRPTVAGGEGTTQWFVVDTLRLGIEDRNGVARADAWKSYGYDLDLRITTSADLTTGGTCKRRAGAPANVLLDGNGGIDNNFGAHFMQTMKSLKSDIEDASNAQIHDGSSGTLLLRLDHVADPDSQSVPGALYATAPSAAPAFDGNDVLPVDASSVDGALDKPLANFPDGYMVGGTWVSGELPGAPFPLPLHLGGARMMLALAGGVITVHVDDGKNGTIAGVVPAASFGTAMTPFATRFGICPGNATFDQLITTMTQSADLVATAPEFQDTAVECDALSLGFGFTMVKAAPPTTIVAAPAPVDGCK